MHAFDALGDPVRRRILELLAVGDLTSGEVVETISAELGIRRPAVSMQLKVLREHGFATLRPDGTRSAAFWTQRLDALDTEIRRGRREEAAED